MVFDSLKLLCACALFAAGIGSWWMTESLPARSRLYLRFAAMLLAAIAVAVPFGISDDVAVFLLPLAAVSLMIAALARFASHLPVPIVTLALIAGLAAGLGAMLWNFPVLALGAVIFASLTIVAAALNGTAATAALAGMALLGAGLALLEQGAGSGFLLLCAAALVGLAKPVAKKSALAIQQ